MVDENKIENEEELKNVDGGGTWDPIDYNCPHCNNAEECTYGRGQYDNCPRCRLY